MEQQHPIPQQISAYEFRLVGDMTLKQFFQVAGGALVALLFYTSNLSAIFKWPLVILSFLMGVALAFFPYDDRPISKWIVLLFKAIYSPTIYIWKKAAVAPSFYQPEKEDLPVAPVEVPTIPAPEPIDSEVSPIITVESQKLEQNEQAFLSRLSQTLSQPAAPAPVVEVKQAQPVNIPTVDKSMERNQETPVIVNKTPVPQTVAATSDATLEKSRVAPMISQVLPQSQTANYSVDASPPSPPTRPNVVVGQVLDSEGKIIEGAILEIKDAEGRAVRALKTNKLGHFMIVTPLNVGKYQITTEKENFAFDPVTIDVKDQIILPVAIWSKKQN